MADKTERTEREEVASPPRSAAKYLAACLAGGLILLAAALLVLRPYARLERFAMAALSRHAPPGASVNDISVGFPLDIVLTNLSVPVQMQDRERDILIKELTGSVSMLSLVRGELKVEINADFFGGSLWLDISTGSPSRLGSSESSHLAFDARARGVDIAKTSEFLGAGLQLLGDCDADVEGELNGRNLATLKGWAFARGRDIHMPPLDFDKVTLPENYDVEFAAKLSAREGKILIDQLLIDGTAYRMSGKGVIRISDPLEQSPIDCSFSVVFREPPTFIDRRFAGMGAEYLMDAIVESGAEVFFNLSGSVRKPEVDLDASSSIASILQESRR